MIHDTTIMLVRERTLRLKEWKFSGSEGSW
jgi:hypothetical protein